METLLRLCGVALVALFSALITREKNKNAAYLISAVAFSMILLFVIKGPAAESIKKFITFTENSSIAEYAVIMFKALAIAYITSITSALCRSAGEELLSKGVEFAGKAEMFILSVPLVVRLIETATEVMT